MFSEIICKKRLAELNQDPRKVIMYACEKTSYIIDLVEEKREKREEYIRITYTTKEDSVKQKAEEYIEKESKEIEVLVKLGDKLAKDFGELIQDTHLMQIRAIGIQPLETPTKYDYTELSTDMFEFNENTYNIRAKGILNEDGTFTVLKGSRMVYRSNAETYYKKHLKNLNMLKDCIRDKGNCFEFVKDFTFEKPLKATECLKAYTGIHKNPWKNNVGAWIDEVTNHRKMLRAL